MRQRAHAQHGEGNQRDAQCHTPPEASRHVAEFGVLFLRSRDGHWLQRHAADRTRSRLVAHDFGMHGTGPLRSRGGDGHFGFESHAALWARSGARLANLGIHGTDVRCGSSGHAPYGSNRGELWCSHALRQELLRVSLEFAGTALAAEIVRDAPVRKGRGGPSFVHVHAANRITLQLWGWLNRDSANLNGSGHSSRFVIGRQILRRVCTELLGATFAAEVEKLACMLDGSGGLDRIDRHSADRIFVNLSGGSGRCRRIGGDSVCWRVRVRDVFRGIGDEAMHASRGAEAVADAQVLGVASGFGRID
jgi:hypothetical protein